MICYDLNTYKQALRQDDSHEQFDVENQVMLADLNDIAADSMKGMVIL